MEIAQLVPKLQVWAVEYGLRIVSAIIILLIGYWIVRILRTALQKALTGARLDKTLVSFVANVLNYLLLALVLIAALAELGVQTASLIALLGAAGLAIGLALRGFFSNLAAGMVLMIVRPFRVNDFIVMGNVMGSVEEVQIFTTRIITPDNIPVVVPNSRLMQDAITNYSLPERRREDMVFGVSYDDDIDHVRAVLKDIMDRDTRILRDPEPLIAVTELADSSMKFLVRFWVKSEDWWDTKLSVTETVKKRFDAEGISIPYPTRQVNVYKKEAAS